MLDLLTMDLDALVELSVASCTTLATLPQPLLHSVSALYVSKMSG